MSRVCPPVEFSYCIIMLVRSTMAVVIIHVTKTNHCIITKCHLLSLLCKTEIKKNQCFIFKGYIYPKEKSTVITMSSFFAGLILMRSSRYDRSSCDSVRPYFPYVCDGLKAALWNTVYIYVFIFPLVVTMCGTACGSLLCVLKKTHLFAGISSNFCSWITVWFEKLFKLVVSLFSRSEKNSPFVCTKD